MLAGGQEEQAGAGDPPSSSFHRDLVLEEASLKHVMSSGSEEMQDPLEIGLDANEAIVLFELLSRWCDPKTGATPAGSCFESTAECVVLHRLLGGLEKQLVVPFKQDYAETLAQARSRLQHDWDYPTLNG